MTPVFDENDIDIRAARYLIATTVGRCGHCGRPTLLVALCLPPRHERLEVDEECAEDGHAGVWSRVDRHVFLFHVDNLSDAVHQRVRAIAPCYDFDHATGHGSQWANHCEHCGALVDDVELFCEPEGPFLPISGASARTIRLAAVDEPVEARAAGLADEPEFFGDMSRA